MSQPGSRVHALQEVLLTTGAALGTLCIILSLSSALFGVTPLVFRSGSMSPAVETGDLGFARPVSVDDIHAGIVVSVENARGIRVTHRVVSSTVAGNSATLVLKGDANDAADPEPYVVTSADRLMFAVPKAGYVVTWMTGPAGVFLGGLLAGLLLLLILGKRAPREPPKHDEPPKRRGSWPRRRGTVTTTVVGCSVLLLAALAPGVVTGLRTTTTLAAWTDPVPVTGTSLASYTVPPPASTAACTPGGTTTTRTVAYAWPAVPTISYLPANVTIAGITGASSFATGGGVTTMTISYSPSGANLSKYATVTVRGALQATPSWRSAATTFRFRTNAGNGTAQCGETTPPTLTFRAPDATTRTVANERTFVSSASGCVYPGIVVCGYRSDASTITRVDYILERVAGGNTRCWDSNASAWAVPCGTYQVALMDVYQGQTVWYGTGNVNAAYALPGAYTLTVRVTDEWGNVGTSAVSFTLT